MFSKEQKERYKRNIVLQQIQDSGQKALFNKKIMVAGAGGLGTSVLFNLASLGVLNIGIIDNDKVELSNLNRQFIHKQKNLSKYKVDSAKHTLEEFNQDLNIKTYKKSFSIEDLDILNEYDVIVDCFDSFKSKFDLSRACVEAGKTLVHGAASGFSGQVMSINPRKSACLDCFIPYNNNITISKGVVSPIVCIIGSLQASEVMKIILNKGDILYNKFLSYDCIDNKFKSIKIKRNENCKFCNIQKDL